MDKVRSLYLDILRVLSALYVFIYHVGSIEIGNKPVFSTESFNNSIGLTYLSAHYFVIVFFVLSGFLITMSANRKNITIKSFFIARLGRLYSVLIPALLLSIFVAFVIIRFHFFSSDLIQNNSNIFLRVILNLFFLTQSWNLNATPPLNNPFWSVSYEFMYYLIIASFLLIQGRKKYLAILLIILIAGPKVMFLFPCWLVGSMVYFFIHKKKLLAPKLSLILFITTTILLILIISSRIVIPFTKSPGDHSFYGIWLFFSWNYLADYIFSILIALNIYSLFGFSRAVLPWFKGRFVEKLDMTIRKMSNCSYTLYLFHVPLLFLFTIFIPYNRSSPIHQLVLIITVLFSVFMIATQTEWKVLQWRGNVSTVFEFFIKMFRKL